MKIRLTLVLTAALAGCGDSRSASYATYQELSDAGMIERGWVPPQIPRDALDIRLNWNLDSNVSEGSYRSAHLIDPGARGCAASSDSGQTIRCGSFTFRTEAGSKQFSNVR
jgi:hypothetical protein